jgi:type IV secretion system protein VirD4
MAKRALKSRPKPEGIILGRNTHERQSFGFPGGESPPCEDRIVYHEGDQHLLCIAPTGSGKGRDLIIPNLLTYPGPIVCVDPKGENVQVTARRRRQLGQKVVVLDPFHVVTAGEESDCLNPMDIFNLEGSSLDCDAEMLASQLSVGHAFKTDPFWNDTASGLISGLIAYVAATSPPEARNLNKVESVR